MPKPGKHHKTKVGGGLPSIAVYQPTYSVTVTPPSGASPLPQFDLHWF
ncbi:hypothetical protein C4J86_5312 [Pseudomonas sp. R2-7-07]|nr:hypothetical protein C4J86_5312 [Pseudomonas sp. R2-7-07]